MSEKFRKLNSFLNCMIGSFIGVWIARGCFTYLEYKKRPELYAMRSAPWYVDVLLFGAVCAVVVAVAVVVKLMIRRKLKKIGEETDENPIFEGGVQLVDMVYLRRKLQDTENIE